VPEELNLRKILELFKAIIEPVVGEDGEVIRLLQLAEKCPPDKELFLDLARQHGWQLRGYQWSFARENNALRSARDLFTSYINLSSEPQNSRN
jgi:hypothetical protein